MYFVYILKNTKGRYYIGSSNDLERRLKEHNSNCVSSTKSKGPYSLIYVERFLLKSEALKRENVIKGYKGNNKFDKLVRDSTLSSSLV